MNDNIKMVSLIQENAEKKPNSPVTWRMLANLVSQLSDAPNIMPSDAEIFEVLTKLGIPSQLKGFTYLNEAIKMICVSPNMEIMKLYPAIARKHVHASAGTVERAIRYAIDMAWSRNNTALTRYFGGICSKPKNGEFITFISKKLML